MRDTVAAALALTSLMNGVAGELLGLVPVLRRAHCDLRWWLATRPLTFGWGPLQQKQPGAGPENPLQSSALAAAGLEPGPSGYYSPVVGLL